MFASKSDDIQYNTMCALKRCNSYSYRHQRLNSCDQISVQLKIRLHEFKIQHPTVRWHTRKGPQRQYRGETKQNANNKEERRKKRRQNNTNPSRDCHIESYMRNFIGKKKEADYFAQQQHPKSTYG